MKRNRGYIWLLGGLVAVMIGCNRPSTAEQRRAEKHVQDSIALEQQLRTLDYYQAQRDLLLPKADSLLRFFTYEKNAKYQDHGYYVRKYEYGAVRVLVRDDGQPPVLVYKNGKRVPDADLNRYPEAQHLAVVMADINEVEKRIRRTSLQVEKYQKRIQKH